MPLVKINTPVHYHVKKYRICKNKICQGPVSCFDGNMVVSAGMAHTKNTRTFLERCIVVITCLKCTRSALLKKLDSDYSHQCYQHAKRPFLEAVISLVHSPHLPIQFTCKWCLAYLSTELHRSKTPACSEALGGE